MVRNNSLPPERGPRLQTGLLKDYSYFKTGGPARNLLIPSSIAELEDMLKKRDPKAPMFLLGLGSNSLVGDDAFDGDVILFRALTSLSIENEREGLLKISAGVENSAVSQFALDHGLEGAEWLFRLPGQIGATTRMNARCYGGEISQIVSKVVTLSQAGERHIYHDANMFRGYKDTIFMSQSDLIVEVLVQLKPSINRDASLLKMQSCEKDRLAKDQFSHPSCGCVFKNDYKIGVPSGMLLEAAGAKKLRKGGARVAESHANFIFNLSQATARDILELSFEMQDLVYREFGVWLHYEMELLGQVGSDLRQRYLQSRPSTPKPARLDPLVAKFKER